MDRLASPGVMRRGHTGLPHKQRAQVEFTGGALLTAGAVGMSCLVVVGMGVRLAILYHRPFPLPSVLLAGLAAIVGWPVSLLLHEWSHAVAGSRVGQPAERIVIRAFGAECHFPDDDDARPLPPIVHFAGIVPDLVLAMLTTWAFLAAWRSSGTAPHDVLVLGAVTPTLMTTVNAVIANCLPLRRPDGSWRTDLWRGAAAVRSRRTSSGGTTQTI